MLIDDWKALLAAVKKTEDNINQDLSTFDSDTLTVMNNRISEQTQGLKTLLAS
jgi:hypothetical protein